MWGNPMGKRGKLLLINLLFIQLWLTLGVSGTSSIVREAEGHNCQHTAAEFTIFLPFVINSNEHVSAVNPRLPGRLSTPNLCDLPLTFPVQSPEIAHYFSQIARPDDLAAIPDRNTAVLPGIAAGQKMVFYRAWAQAEQELPDVTDEIEWVGYNPEHWMYTPLTEQQNLPATVKQAAEFAHDRGLKFMLVPDRRFVEEHLVEMMPYIDGIILQGQRLQADPQAFAAWMEGMIALARVSNPQTKIYVQVGATQGSASEMLAAVETVSHDIDGIAIWSLPRSFELLKEFVGLVRG